MLKFDKVDKIVKITRFPDKILGTEMHYTEVYFSPQYEFCVSPDSPNKLTDSVWNLGTAEKWHLLLDSGFLNPEYTHSFKKRNNQ